MRRSQEEIRTSVSEAKQKLSKLINDVASNSTRVVVEKNGLPIAAIISTKDYEHFLIMEANRARRFEALTRMSESLAHIPIEELESEVEKVIAESRAQYRTDSKKTS